jgi:uncharacterized protein DUF6744
MSEFSDYSNRLKTADVPSLGSLCWYTASEETAVPHADMEAHLQVVGLDAFTPKAPRDDDVFRRVCTNAQRKRVPTADPKVFENYLVRDVQRKGLKVTKQIVREQVDQSNKRLSYDPIVEVEYDSLASNLSYALLGVTNGGSTAVNIAQEIETNFLANRNTLNGYAIRELFRRVLVSSYATGVRNGVYFCGKAHADRIDALERLARMIPNASFHSLPLVDDVKQRTMLREAFEAETVDELRRRLAEIDELLSSPNEVPLKRVLALRDEVKPLKAKLKQYAELLEDNLDGAVLELKAYDTKIVRLLNKSMGAAEDDD